MYRTPRRTFRPDALDDRLETRDLLTVLAGLPVSLSSAGLGLGMSSPITTTSYTSVVHYVTPSSNSTRSFTRTVIARPTVSTVNLGLVNAGFFVNNSAALSSLTNGEFNPGYASTTGLAFTNGLGFNSLAAQSQFYNTATNGLIFNNGLASGVSGTAPEFGLGGNNAAFASTSGLVFTNGLGFNNPSARNQFSSSTATSGLAFTNGLGFNSLSSRGQFFNTATNGLIFNNGTAAAVTPASVSNFGSSVGFSSAFAPFVF